MKEIAYFLSKIDYVNSINSSISITRTSLQTNKHKANGCHLVVHTHERVHCHKSNGR